MMKLYDLAPSGNCHKVRLLLSLLGLDYALATVDMANGELQSAAFLGKNPFGQVPVLEDDAVVLRDSQAILVYLARRYDRDARWLPDDAEGQARVTAWLATAANEIARGPASLRLHYLFGVALDLEAATRTSNQVLGILEAHLSGNDWLVRDRASLADVAIYPYVALAPQARIELAPYPAIRAWMKRMQALPGYVSMPGMRIE